MPTFGGGRARRSLGCLPKRASVHPPLAAVRAGWVRSDAETPTRGDTLPLSEHEERILAEIERQLAADDPRFVARARRRRPLTRSIRLRLAIVLAVLGILSVVGLVVHIAFGALGMLLLFGAIVLAATALNERQDRRQVDAPPNKRG